MSFLNTPYLGEVKKLYKISNINVKILVTAVFFLPIALVAGPAVMEFFLIIISVNFIILCFKNEYKIKLDIYFFFILAWYLLIIISSIVSEHPLLSLKSSFLSFRFILLIYAIIYLGEKVENFYKIFLFILFFTLSICVIDGYIQTLFGKNLLLISKTNPYTTSGFFGEEKKLGSYIVRLIPICFGLYLYLSKENQLKKNTHILICSFLTFPLILFSNERMAMLFFSFIVICIIFTYLKNDKKKFFLISFIFVLIPIIIYTFSINRFDSKVINSLTQIYENSKIKVYSSTHEILIINSIRLFKEKPILGIGANNYKRECKKVNSEVNCSTHPHNIFIQLLTETGILGMVFYGIFLFFILKKIVFFFIFKEELYKILMVLPLFFYVNPFFPSGNFFNNWYMCLGIFAFPFLYKIQKTNNDL